MSDIKVRARDALKGTTLEAKAVLRTLDALNGEGTVAEVASRTFTYFNRWSGMQWIPTQTGYRMTESAARAKLTRLAKRGLVVQVKHDDGSPASWHLEPLGLAAIEILEDYPWPA